MLVANFLSLGLKTNFSMSIKVLLRLFRWPNLIIVALTQYLIKYAVFYPVYQRWGIDFGLSELQFALLVFSTVLVAAGGYLINDIYDYSIDVVNKPDKVIVGKAISMRNSWILYFAIHILGFGICTGLAIAQDYLNLLWFFPGAWLLLWLYSYKLKRVPFWGNLVVALFCGAVVLLIWQAEARSFSQLLQNHPEVGSFVSDVLLFYTAFALLSTLFREVVKDLQDIEGDQLYGCRTLPVVWGEKPTKYLAFSFGTLTALATAFWLYWAWASLTAISIGYVAGLLLLPAIYSLNTLRKASEPTGFGKASSQIKILMLLGLLYLPVAFWLG